MKNAVDYLRASDLVDGSRIVVMGHSMGAGAALDYATNDANLKGAVMISGGWTLGPVRPKNALFIFAEHDPVEPIQDPSTALAAHLAGVSPIELGKTYGDFASGTAVEAIRVPGVNHVTILNSPERGGHNREMARQHIRDAEDRGDRAGGPEACDPANRAVGISNPVDTARHNVRLDGAALGGRPPGPSGWVGVLIVGGALLVAMPLAAANPASFVPVLTGRRADLVVRSRGISHARRARALASAGMVPHSRRSRRRNTRRRGGVRSRLRVPSRDVGDIASIVAVTGAADGDGDGRRAAFPFWMGFELLVRRGGMVISTVWAVIGRALILILTAVGVSVRALPFVLILILPIIGIALVMIEIFSASAYSASRNLTLIAVFETLWFAWMIAATNPITFMF